MSKDQNASKPNRASPIEGSDFKSKRPPPGTNAILNSLPANQRQEIVPKLKTVSLEMGARLYQPEETIEYIYFPTAGIISLLAAFEDGSTVEAGVIGNEGFLGTPVALGAETTPHQAIVQLPGEAMRMSAGDLRAAAQNDGSFLEAMLRYTNVMFTQVAQTAACNRIHTLEQRLTRWLLLTHDRVGGDEFDLTQEFLSRMLGVRRAGVSVAANELRHSGLIDYQRGKVLMLDRKALQARSCECYEFVQQEYDRYLSR